jgi:hypothetical protein
VFLSLVWESEEWLKQHAKPLSSGGGGKRKWRDTNNLLTRPSGLRGHRSADPEEDDATGANDAIQEDQ